MFIIEFAVNYFGSPKYSLRLLLFLYDVVSPCPLYRYKRELDGSSFFELNRDNLEEDLELSNPTEAPYLDQQGVVGEHACWETIFPRISIHCKTCRTLYTFQFRLPPVICNKMDKFCLESTQNK